MSEAGWWANATKGQKEQIVRLLNGDATVRWPFRVPPVRTTATKALQRTQERMRQKRSLGLPPLVSDMTKQFGTDHKFFFEHYQRIGQFYAWRDGGELPHDLRRCRREKCRKFFLVRKNRPGRVFCLTSCARNHHASVYMAKEATGARERKLARVRAAMKKHRPRTGDWKFYIARKARVSRNFVSYAIRRGDFANRVKRKTGKVGTMTLDEATLLKPDYEKIFALFARWIRTSSKLKLVMLPPVGSNKNVVRNFMFSKRPLRTQ
jgi:hypothetical protein